MAVDAPNAGQIEFWNGKAGEKWTENQESQDRMIALMGAQAFQAAGFRPGERVLDIGCGCGTTSFEIARAVGLDGAVTGIDVSRPMLEWARARAAEAGIENVTFLEADAATTALPGGADVAYSRFGVMFFDDPAAAFGNMRRWHEADSGFVAPPSSNPVPPEERRRRRKSGAGLSRLP